MYQRRRGTAPEYASNSIYDLCHGTKCQRHRNTAFGSDTLYSRMLTLPALMTTTQESIQSTFIILGLLHQAGSTI